MPTLILPINWQRLSGLPNPQSEYRRGPMKGPDRKIQELAGHKTIQMSVRYAHLNPAHKLAAVERIAKPAIGIPPGADERPNSHQNSHQAKALKLKQGKKIVINYS